MEMMSKEMAEQHRISSSRLLVEKYKRMVSEEKDESSRYSNSITEEKQKTMLSEEGDSSSRDTNSTNPSVSPPHKRPRGTLVFKSTADLLKIDATFSTEDLMKIDAEDVLAEDYVDWFMSLRGGVDEDEILCPLHYCEWFSTLGSEAKAEVVYPYFYTKWFATKFNKLKPMVFPSSADLIEIHGESALDDFNEINKCDYEYVRDVGLNSCGDRFHLNFYGRRKVSPSRPESEAPQTLFFAEVEQYEETVLKCCILDSDEFGDARVRLPPGFYCPKCSGDCASLEEED